MFYKDIINSKNIVNQSYYHVTTKICRIRNHMKKYITFHFIFDLYPFFNNSEII